MQISLSNSPANPLLNQHLRGGSDPILALFANGEQGVYGDLRPGTTSVFSDVGGASVISNSDTVALISDISGNGNDLVQSTASARPSYSDGLFTMDGIDDVIATSGVFNPQTPWYLCVVMQQPGSSASEAYKETGVGLILNSYNYIHLYTQPGHERTRNQSRAANASPSVAYSQGNGTFGEFPAGSPHVVELRHEANRLRVYVNGALTSDRNHSWGGSVSSSAWKFSFSDRNGSAGENDPKFGSFVASAKSVTDSERAAVREAFASRHGITLP